MENKQTSIFNNVIGKSVHADLHNINPDLLKDLDFISDVLNESVTIAKAHFVDSIFKQFGGEGGITGVIILSESSVTIHTYPEYGYAAVDYFTCGDECDPMAATMFISNKFNATIKQLKVLERGL